MESSRFVMDEPGYGRSPVVAVDRAGRFWAAWISWTAGGECVRFSHKELDCQWSDPRVCSHSHPFVTSLSVAPFKDGVLVAWTDGDKRKQDGLKLVEVNREGAGPVTLVETFDELPMHASLSTFENDSKSVFALAWSSYCGEKRSVCACLGESPEDYERVHEISEGKEHNTRPSVACFENDAVVAWQCMDQGESRIMARRFEGGEVATELIGVSPGMHGIAAMPDVVRAGENVFIAWQSDYDEEDGPGLVRWVEVARLDADGALGHPAAAMTGVERKGEGEDQGFESPSLTVLDDGRLVVIGRGSQSIRRQDLGEGGYSSRIQVDEAGWQCRGRKFTACRAPSGLLVAGREREGVVVRFLAEGDPKWSGSPEIEIEALEQHPILSLPPRYNNIVAGKRVIFGDIHQHTAASDGTGTWEETYCRAQYRYGDQLAAVSDHESFLGKRTPPGEWFEACRAADEFYRSGSFVTLHASEWTGKMHPGPGHKVVYFPPSGGPVLSRDDDATAESVGLVREARKLGALVFPHHVGWTGADMDAHDPGVQTCFEVVSCHGAYEQMRGEPIGTRGDDKEGQFARDALDAGLRFGFVGGSDGHGLDWHHGVSRKRDSHRTGLVALFPKETSREGVLEALRSRRCYATSGAKIRMWFEIDGRPMGEELVSADPLPFRVVISATDRVAHLSLQSNSGEEIPLETDGTEADIRGTVLPPDVRGWRYFYVRVIQEDQEVAWSSPIWIDSPGIA